MNHVVVVEDDPHNATLFRKLLEKRMGCEVTLTLDPAHLLEVVATRTVDVVIMDVSIKGSTWQGRPVNGVELCRILKSDPATAGIPVLLATAHAMRGDAERLLRESGADRYLAKPIVDHDAFIALVRGMVREAA